MENEISMRNISLLKIVLPPPQKTGNEAAYLNNTDVPELL